MYYQWYQFQCNNNIENDPSDAKNPLSREIIYDRGLPQRCVVDTLRYHWIRPAPEDIAIKSVFAKHDYWETIALDEVREKAPEVVDLEIDSQWKQNIYKHYAHLFMDISKFIPFTGVKMGHFHEPDDSIPPYFAITSQTVCKTFDTNVLVVPAYLAPGCRVDTSVTEGDIAYNAGSFNNEQRFSVFFFRKGIQVDFVAINNTTQDLSAVMVVCQLCTDADGEEDKYLCHMDHGDYSDSEDEDDEDAEADGDETEQRSREVINRGRDENATKVTQTFAHIPCPDASAIFSAMMYSRKQDEADKKNRIWKERIQGSESDQDVVRYPRIVTEAGPSSSASS